ncbi:type I restriction enzyme HsdR N-terminal domain-containing protein [Sediminibacterium roseum]|uniref:Type I restriction enzyme HsdR N-terminal domain-containing protein n=1 Tax=Sediminibacterium roseum TaxID=1978412 RepID=A0ABW9ZV25_9BACT|nr:type I restriction enzyme HsdR N-terminal domain-containing protein [Sediminibacterium roseum]NCI50995.1 type I restriction enzyme HsdR N-terminal domain-containing protein [Sediminibacterium roseum]
MTRIEYPPFDFRIKKENEKEWIFDEVRKQWVRLTPEEWVRQNILQYLLQVKKYPASLIAVEKEIALGELRKRFDILVYKEAKPWMIIECKEMNVPLSEATIRQILNYNITIRADYIMVTNGTEHRAFCIAKGIPEPIAELPETGSSN